MSLIADLFPGITLDSATYAELQVAISNQVDAAGLINHPSWNLKLVQVTSITIAVANLLRFFLFYRMRFFNRKLSTGDLPHICSNLFI